MQRQTFEHSALFSDDLVNRLPDDGDDDAPLHASFSSQICVVDMVGFTSLTNKVIRTKGKDGIDDLLRSLNNRFDAIGDTLDRAGFRIADYIGDSMLAYRDLENSDDSSDTIELKTLEQQVRSAMTGASGTREMPVSFHSEFRTGTVDIVRLGSMEHGWLLLLTGSAIASGKSVTDWSLSSKGASHPNPRRPRLEGTFDQDRSQYLSSIIKERTANRISIWVPEIHEVASAFSVLRSGQATLETLGAFVSVLQHEATENGGWVDQICHDEKGIYARTTFGVPPLRSLSREYGPLRFAVAAREKLKSQNIDASHGISRGPSLCAMVGTDSRCRFNIFGDSVNLASRLSGLCGSGEILSTVTPARHRDFGIAFAETRIPLPKGFDQLPSVYQVSSHERSSGNPLNEIWMAGRDGARKKLETCIENFGGLNSQTAIIAGEPGAGKSLLVRWLCGQAAKREITVLEGRADTLGKDGFYKPWRAIIQQLVVGNRTPTPGEFDNSVTQIFDPDHPDSKFLSLLGLIVPSNLGLSKSAESLTGPARETVLRRTVLSLFERVLEGKPAIIVFEDAHWFDPQSFSLIRELVDRIPNLLAVITTRLESSTTDRLSRIARNSIYTWIELGPLSETETVSIVKQHYPEAQDDLAAWIHDVSGGNPYFSCELLETVREEGFTEIKQPIEAGNSVREAFADVESIETAISRRIDSLSLQSQAFLKSASVAGASFSEVTVTSITSISGIAESPRPDIQELVSRRFISPSSGQPPGEFEFVHDLVRQSAYHMVPHQTRTILHRNMANHLRLNRKQYGFEVHALLAHHYEKGEQAVRAVAQYSQAGQTALRNGAHENAMRSFERAASIATTVRDTGTPVHERHFSIWECGIAAAQYGMGEIGTASKMAVTSLNRLKVEVPTTPAAWQRFIAGSIARRALGMRQPGLLSRNLSTGQTRKVAAEASAIIAECSYFSSGFEQILGSCILGLGLSQSPAYDGSVTRIRTLLGLLSGLARLDRLALNLFHKAQSSSTRERDLRGILHSYSLETVYHYSFGRWNEGTQRLQIGYDAAVESNDPHVIEVLRTLFAMAHQLQGRFSQGEKDFLRVLESASRRNSRMYIAWGHYGSAKSSIRDIGKKPPLEKLEQARASLQNLPDQQSHLICNGLYSLALLRSGKTEEAMIAAKENVKLMQRLTSTNFGSLEGYSCTTETLLSCYIEKKSEENIFLFKKAMKEFRKYAILFPIGRPRYQYISGWADIVLKNRPHQAIDRWQKSIRVASKYHMHYDRLRSGLSLVSSKNLAPRRRQSFREEVENISNILNLDTARVSLMGNIDAEKSTFF